MLLTESAFASFTIQKNLDLSDSQFSQNLNSFKLMSFLSLFYQLTITSAMSATTPFIPDTLLPSLSQSDYHNGLMLSEHRQPSTGLNSFHELT